MTSPPRKPLAKDEKLAAALLWIAHLQGEAIPVDHARAMTAGQIISLFHFDHDRTVATGGDNHPANLTPRWRRSHIIKTAAIDNPRIKKGNRIRKAAAEHHEAMRRKLLARPEAEDRPKYKRRHQWPKGRKIESRGFAKREKVR